MSDLTISELVADATEAAEATQVALGDFAGAQGMSDDLAAPSSPTEANKGQSGDPVVYRYLGPGFMPGVPARDLAQADLARIGAQAAAQVATGSLYEAVVGHSEWRQNSDEMPALPGPEAVRPDGGKGSGKGKARRK